MFLPENFYNVNSSDHFRDLLSADLERVSLISFWAPWAAPCTQMNEVVFELAKKYPQVLVLQVEAEEQADITESFDIEAVPSFLILRGHTLLARISGADAAALTSTLATHTQSLPSIRPLSKTSLPPSTLSLPTEETEKQLEKRLRGLMSQSKVVLFMKGDPDRPRCGFSRKAVDLLREQKVEFTHFDIFSDESVRQGLKVLNDWPTFPQFIVSGEFIGGLDVVTEMVQNGEFAEVVDRRPEAELISL